MNSVLFPAALSSSTCSLPCLPAPTIPATTRVRAVDMLSGVPRLRLTPQASPFTSRLAPCLHRIGFTCVQADSSASGCSPPRLATTQLPSAAAAHADGGIRLSRSEFMDVMTHWWRASLPAVVCLEARRARARHHY